MGSKEWNICWFLCVYSKYFWNEVLNIFFFVWFVEKNLKYIVCNLNNCWVNKEG